MKLIKIFYHLLILIKYYNDTTNIVINLLKKYRFNIKITVWIIINKNYTLF